MKNRERDYRCSKHVHCEEGRKGKVGTPVVSNETQNILFELGRMDECWKIASLLTKVYCYGNEGKLTLDLPHYSLTYFEGNPKHSSYIHNR